MPLFSQDLGDFNAVDSTLARDPAWRSHYIDFCSPASVERIASSRPFTLRDTGDYHWAVINWAPFFRVRAAIPLPGGDTVFTHDGPIARHLFPDSDNPYYVTEPAQSLLQGPSEDALVRKNNGGTWFRFLRPLRLTEADLDSGNASLNGDLQAPDGSTYVHVPFLKATAVPYREGEDVMRETYEFSVDVDESWARGTFGMRLELYLIGDNVVAATVHSYPTDGNLAPPEVPVIFFAQAKEDGSLSLQDYARSPVFDGFLRKPSVGQEGSVAWDPGAHGQPARTLAYRLTEIKKMN
ncbi:MAG TPA: hypothetical protein VJ385_23215 [Fibrobacteria bacterium]|nr:hypothetical protein [Fibrobacteria bacterium]